MNAPAGHLLKAFRFWYYECAGQHAHDPVGDCCIRSGLDAVLPQAIADELDRQAEELSARQREMREEDSRTIRSSGLGEAVRRLRERAAELRGQL